jgi:hypothetical protein
MFDFIKSIILFFSRAWVIPATIAGKLMTNQFIYFEAINMSSFLWRVWNIIRSMANYAVGVIFLWNIIKAVMSAEFGVSKLFEVLKKVVIAVIGINISRFVIALMVDLSIVGAAAASSMPLSVMEQLRPQVATGLKIPSQYNISRDSTTDLKSCGSRKVGDSINTGLTLQNILPNADNLAGPMIFFGAAIFRSFEATCIDITETNTWNTVVLGVFLQILIILLYVIPLIILAVINMMRIFWIWIWIMLSPLIVLDWAMTDNSI